MRLRVLELPTDGAPYLLVLDDLVLDDLDLHTTEEIQAMADHLRAVQPCLVFAHRVELDSDRFLPDPWEARP